MKLSIKSRIFWIFLVFIMIILNIFSYILYISVENNFLKNTDKSIYEEFGIITDLIKIYAHNDNDFFSISSQEIKKINSLWYFIYLSNSNNYNNFSNWFSFTNDNNRVFKGKFRDYTIVIWKNLSDLDNIKNIFIDTNILLNIIFIIVISIFSYSLAHTAILPLNKLASFLDKYDVNKNHKLIINNYSQEDIWKLINSINKFIKKIKNILEKEKEFLQDISHEIKTPLMQIDTTLELMKDKKKLNLEKEIEQIENSTHKINKIISKLSFLVKWEEISHKKEKIDIFQYMDKLLEQYKYLLNEKKIKLVVNKEENFIIENNKYYLDRLLENIISNAIYYNKWNNILEITIQKNFISIKDQWIWIKEEELEKIFDRFFRNQNSNMYYSDGNWLWLSIIKKIVNMFDWKLEIESKTDKWTEIKIYF